MKKETIDKNLIFVRIQARNLYILLLQEEYNAADDVVDEIDENIKAIQDDVDQILKALGGDGI